MLMSIFCSFKTLVLLYYYYYYLKKNVKGNTWQATYGILDRQMYILCSTNDTPENKNCQDLIRKQKMLLKLE